MPRTNLNVDAINKYFQENPDQTFSSSQLESVYFDYAQSWAVPEYLTFRKFLKVLLTKTRLRELRLRSRNYPSLVRYSWGGKPSAVSAAISIKEGSYFSHESAMWIHGLAESHINIFINKEQSEKSRISDPVSQEAIHRAFRNKQRHSRLIYEYRGTTITVLSGKHTAQLAVEVVRSPSGHEVHVTSLERTLIDIAVRPAYSGGVSAVLNAYRLARARTHVDTLMALLAKLDYVYPYHQSIGFYLKRAGYSDADQLLARKNGVNLDFYLCHDLKDPAFDPGWRIFFPSNLK